ncbi:hypothetical protein ONZ45_g7198 [Pleurotus djamor]|nr:hypothetical protein ONZ45_g7198 [Pleurotus djamor]
MAATKKQARNNSSSAPSTIKEDPNAPPMLRFQASLPNLPVPPLQSTFSKYLDTVKPHLTPSEFQQTTSLVKEFLSSPFSAELQRRLEARANEVKVNSNGVQEKARDNWLSDWWNEAAYMGYRDPVVVFVSYFFVHLDDKKLRGVKGANAKRAANLVKATMAFRKMVEEQTLEPERAKQPLCMASYKWLFHSSRYPVIPSDTAKKFDPATHNHIVVVRKNQFFEVPLVNGHGMDLSAGELEVQFEKVIAMAGESEHPSVGVLTSDNRDNWARNRELLISENPENAKLLERIESAMIVVCLDDTKPVTREDISWKTWVGDGKNRFYDKHQFIVYDNGRSGFLGEHSCMDGTPTLRLNEFILASLALNKIDLGWARSTQTGLDASILPPPTPLSFKITPAITQAISSATENFNNLVGEHEMEVLHYEGYGKSLMKKLGVSPDAWTQMVKQLAFHKLNGRPGVTYESAQTRKYKLGRTEVIRSASNESKAFVDAMNDHGASDVTREALFKDAAKRHNLYGKWAADGEGVDRHMFGLRKLVKAEDGEEMPAVFKDPAFGKTSHWELSTSQLSSPWIDGWGYGEVVPDGFGLSYAIGEDHIRWTITCIKNNQSAKVLKHYLAEAATEVRQMMERAAKEKVKDEKEKAKL